MPCVGVRKNAEASLPSHETRGKKNALNTRGVSAEGKSYEVCRITVLPLRDKRLRYPLPIFMQR